MLTVVYSECRKVALYAECHYAEYARAECRYAECRGAIILGKLGHFSANCSLQKQLILLQKVL